MAHVEICLPYFKQGDDLSYHVESTDSPANAFKCHAHQLEDAVSMLKKIAEILDKYTDVSVEACTHHISLDGPEEMVKELVNAELGRIPEWLEEEEEEYEEEEDEE